MGDILTENELVKNLNQFRNVLVDYDYSEVNNVIFLNLESLNSYMKTHKNNPFERQYYDLEKIFNKIIPYIPSNIPNEAIDAITNILESRENDKELIKKNITFNIKMDFIQTVKSITSEKDWNQLLKICNDIRESKMNYLTH
ncbi:MAG: hypothetical protein ACLFMO_01945 [Eubacteriales bacterium]